MKGRIIDGAVFDAKAEAEQIRDRARADAQAIRDDARREAEAMIARAGAHAPPSSPAIVTDAPPGKVTEISGLVARATIEGVFLGEVVRIDRAGRAPVAAEVVGFRGEDAVLLPLGELAGVSPRGEVRRTGVPLQITAGEALLGRVLDGLGHPIDQGPPIAGEAWAVDREAPPPLARAPITKPLATGVRAVDGFATLGEGQRVGLFAGSGVGKSTLLGQIARGADADVVVVGLVGERGRELGDALLGRVLDGLGRPIDGKGEPPGLEPWAVDRPAPSPLERPRIAQPLETGVRAIDGFLTLGEGQRVGLFAGSGVGKSTLLGQIARNAQADVIVVCLVGERGRELAELLGDELAPARARTVVVCATSDAPPLVRLRAVHTATAAAEWFRDRRGAN
ncbi:MAG TPA: hypothetical protein VL463_20285, partial [Kofleriaceae bacterium]|nr:hypothetical protein [Kofleriaceae bacterium]